MSPALSAKKQIELIQDRVDQIELLINDHLPRHYQRTLEKIYGAKWLRQTLWKEAMTKDHMEKIKRWKLDIGNFRFQCAEVVERLIRCLFDLDNILSEGNRSIRDMRKLQVVRIQDILNGFEPLRRKSEFTFLHYQTWITINGESQDDAGDASDVDTHMTTKEQEYPPLSKESQPRKSKLPLEEEPHSDEEDDLYQLEDQEMDASDVDANMATKEQEHPSLPHGSQSERESQILQEEANSEEEADPYYQEDQEMNESDDDTNMMTKEEEHLSLSHGSRPQDESTILQEEEAYTSQLEDQEMDVGSNITTKEFGQKQMHQPLHYWYPHTQWIDCRNSVHLRVDLPGMTKDQVEVTVNADSGVVRISGVNAYGYFDIQKQLRTNLVVLDQSRVEWHSGAFSWLELIIPRRSSFHNRHQYRTNYQCHPLFGLAW